MSKWALAVLLLLCGSAAAQHDASQMRLQLLNGRTGKPVAQQRVVLMAGDGVPKHALTHWSVATTDGEGYVSLPEQVPVPQLVVVFAEGFRSCAKDGSNRFAVQKIAAGGLVSDNACKPRITLYPQPGTLVYFVRPETWLERMRE